MILDYVMSHIIIPAHDFLPLSMEDDRSSALMVAIGLQESEFKHRFQVMGPARSYFQFEKTGGIHGVLSHPKTKPIISAVLDQMDYTNISDQSCYEAVAHNDLLACDFARCLIYTVPQPLPGPGETEEAWIQYVAAWRPGKPRKATWAKNFETAWKVVNEWKNSIS